MSGALTASQILQILKGKCAKIFASYDTPSISVLLVLASNEGAIFGYSWSESFQRYSKMHSGIGYYQTFEKLARDAIVNHSGNVVHFANLGIYSAESKELCTYISELEFKKREDEIVQTLESILSLPEGKALLEKLHGKVTSFGLTQIEKYLGKEFVRETVRQLIEKELLFSHSGVAKYANYIYYTLSPAVEHFLKDVLQGELDEETLEALSFVHASQNVRSEGVLLENCSRFSTSVSKLWLRHLIMKNQWYRFQTYRTTDEGATQANRFVIEKMRIKKDELDRLLGSLNLALVRFLIDKYLTKRLSMSTSIEFGYCQPQPYTSYDCILADPQMARKTALLFAGLVEMGLATVATEYVSTRRGETRGERYCISKEVLQYLDESCKSARRFSSSDEKAHSLFHLFYDLGTNRNVDNREFFATQLQFELQSWDIAIREFEDEATVLAKVGAVALINGQVKVLLQQETYNRTLREHFILPIVEKLTGERRLSYLETFQESRAPQATASEGQFISDYDTLDELISKGSIDVFVRLDRDLEQILKDICLRNGCDDETTTPDEKRKPFSKWGFTEYMKFLEHRNIFTSTERTQFYNFHNKRNSIQHTALEPSENEVRAFANQILEFVRRRATSSTS